MRHLGGMNHTTRTFFYHVLHLLRAGVEPFFVFDGPGKPAEKGSRHPTVNQPCRHIAGSRNRIRLTASSARTSADMTCERQLSHVIPLCRDILDNLGVAHRDAPGEAEAECAALEKAGIVDAVLTRDGDSFVFGSRTVLQKLNAESKIAMVRRFKMGELEAARPMLLRRQDFFLIAMMSGGDYDEGIPGCGSRIALEAARQGYGSELEQLIKHGRPESLVRWKAKLVDELRDNQRNRFSKRWVAIANAVTRSNFPNPKVAEYYLKPAVSPTFEGLQVDWTRPALLSSLREWTEEYFDWRHGFHAGKFVRVLALPLLTRKLLAHIEKETDGSFMINKITLCRGDEGDPRDQDLRVEFLPSRTVEIDISGEEIVEGYRANMKEVFDPNTPIKEWIPRWIVEHGAPTAFRKWGRHGREMEDLKGGSRKSKRKASVSSTSLGISDTQTKRPRDSQAQHTQTARQTAVSISKPSIGIDTDRGSPDFPDITELARRPTTSHPRRRTSLGVSSASLHYDQHDIVDLTRD